MKEIKQYLEIFLIFLVLGIMVILFIIFNKHIRKENLDTSYMWNVNFSNLRVSEGSKEGNISLVDNNLNAYVTLKQGEYLEFFLDIINTGSLDAVVKNVNFDVQSSSNNLKYYLSYINGNPLHEGDEIKSNESNTIKVRIEYPNIDGNVASSTLKISLSIDLEVKK